jgi:hypothetical protein
MNKTEAEIWQSKSQQFYLVWFSFLGGMMVLGEAFSSGRSIVDQGIDQLGKFGSERLLLGD